MTSMRENQYLYYPCSNLLAFKLLSHLQGYLRITWFFPIPFLQGLDRVSGLFLNFLKEEGLTHPTYRYRLRIFMDPIHPFVHQHFLQKGGELQCILPLAPEGVQNGQPDYPFTCNSTSQKQQLGLQPCISSRNNVAIAGALIPLLASVNPSLYYILMPLRML